MTGETFWCENAWLDGEVVESVQVGVGAGRITAIETGVPPAASSRLLRGLVIPGNGQRALARLPPRTAVADAA